MQTTSEANEGASASTDSVPSRTLLDSSNARKAILLAIFCLALFVDAFMTSAMIICLNKIGSDFNQPASIVSWVLTSYNLTFGAFLLLAGRISDIYHPKPVFVAGFFFIGILGIGAGFVNNIIALVVLRALQGIGAAMTIPSATSMLRAAYATPLSQGIALTFFAAAGTLGLCLGFLLGGLILQFSSWRWVLWIVPMVTIPLSIASVFLIPGQKLSGRRSAQNMDIIGVSMLICSIILLIYSFSQAPITGWGTPRVIAPLVISIVMIVLFFVWQTRLPEAHALIPPRMWFIPNFLVLVFVSFCTQIYLTGPILILSEYWSGAFGWDPLKIGLHVLPMGLTSTVVFVFLPLPILKLPPRLALLGANSLAGFFSILMIYASSEDRYWSRTFPSMILITIGSSAAYLLSNVGIVTSVPDDRTGVAAAIFSAAQQVGGAINIAIITTILVQVRNKHPFPSYRGPSSALWLVVALGIAQALTVLIFFKPKKAVTNGDPPKGGGLENGTVSGEKS